MTSTHTKSQSKSVSQTFKETIESLIVAFILAFVFRAFVVEAFVIPTGSMADTLRGAHFNLNCQKCGYQYNYGFIPEKYFVRDKKTGHAYRDGNNNYIIYPKSSIPPYPVSVKPDRSGELIDSVIPICPTCGTQFDTSQKKWVSNGDRILVLKYIYQFKDPDTWDVVVFKNPTDPQENYIKRLIGRPGETVEVVDGDVYINHNIQQKPKHIQDNLWLVAFDNNYQPQTDPQKKWEQPFTAQDSTKWKTKQPDHSFIFEGSDSLDTLSFNSKRLKKACSNFCFYNGPSTWNEAISSDLKLKFVITPQGQKGTIDLSLGKYGRNYTAKINFDGTCTLTSQHSNTTLKLTDLSTGQTDAKGKFSPFQNNHPVEIAFSNLDHQFEIQIGKKKFYHTGPNDPADWGYKKTGYSTFSPPSVSIGATGQPFSLTDIIIYRDTHYTNSSGPSRDDPSQGTEGRPITLKEDQFFVMGDNSPQSYDSRFWSTPGYGNGDKRFRQGIVPREYLIGRAFFVYWPAGYRPHPSVPYAIVPDVGNMRFIH